MTVGPVTADTYAAVQRELIAWMEDLYPGTRWTSTSGPFDRPTGGADRR